MGFIASLVLLILAFVTDDGDIHRTYLIASGLFAIAGELATVTNRLKKFFENGMRIEFKNKEDGKHDGEV